AEHQRHELAGRIVRRAGGNRRRRAALLRACPPAGENLRAIEQHARIDTEIPADQADNDDRADAETTCAAGYAATRFAIVLHIVTWTKIIGTHCSFSFANPSPDAACVPSKAHRCADASISVPRVAAACARGRLQSNGDA